MYDDTAFVTLGPFGSVDYAPHNKGVTPVFFIESVIDPVASEEAGRAIYHDMERVRIYVAGDQFSVAVHPIGIPIWGPDKVEDRFPEEYQKWKRKGQMAVNGTPLAKWPLATPSFIKELEFLNIFSVDDLASVADVHLDRIADGRQWRDRAVAWLKSAKDGAASAQYAAENARLRKEMAELRVMIEGKPKEAKARPGKLYAAMERRASGKAKNERVPMSAERREAASARAKAMWEARKARGK